MADPILTLVGVYMAPILFVVWFVEEGKSFSDLSEVEIAALIFWPVLLVFCFLVMVWGVLTLLFEDLRKAFSYE